MKKKLLVFLSAALCLVVTIWPESNAHSWVNGAPNGSTGSPFDLSGNTCASGGCHSGSPVTPQTGWITSTVPDCGYTPGQTYSVSVFVTSPGRTKFGFSASPQSSTGVNAGTLIAGTGMILTGGGRYITQTSAGTAATETNGRTWTFQWTAPAATVGTVTFYAAMNATNSSNTVAGDLIYTSTLVLQPAPAVLTLTNSTQQTLLCNGASTTLSSNINTGNVWTFNSNEIGSGASISASEGGIYTLTNTTNACIQTQSITLEAYQTNIAPIINPAGNQFICEGESLTLQTNSTDDLVWSPGGETGPDLVVDANGTYSVTASNACGTSTSENVTISIVTLPTAPVITLDSDNNLVATSNGASYVWYLNGTVISNATESTLTPTLPGMYTAEAISSTGCVSESSIAFDLSSLGLASYENAFLEVFPNPSNGIITLKKSHTLNGTLDLLDIAGRKVKSFMLNNSDTQTIFLDCPSGMYFLRLRQLYLPIIIE